MRARVAQPARAPQPINRRLIVFHEALPGLPRMFAERTSTADGPSHHFGGGEGRKVAAGKPGEGCRADRARARRSWTGTRLHLLVIANKNTESAGAVVRDGRLAHIPR
jgi:hypothetical protein